MFVALRDVRFAKGRFALIISVVVMITLLVSLLSGLMTGLREQSISAIEGLQADSIVFNAPVDGNSVSYSDSSISSSQLAAWSSSAESATVQPVGISMGKVSNDSGRISISLFGVESGFTHQSGNVVPDAENAIILSGSAAGDLNAEPGDRVTVNGQDFTVTDVVGDAWYSHTSVAWVQLAAWQHMADTTGSEPGVATVLAVSGMSSEQMRVLANDTGTVTTGVADSFNGVGGYQSENGSLMAMLGMLLAISALVIGAFFTIWTIQRTSDIAILKALGASTWSLVKDALGQAALVLVVGIGVGLALTVAIGTVASSVVPFVLGTNTTLLPGALLMGLGLAGAAFALRTVVTSDPLTAISANR